MPAKRRPPTSKDGQTVHKSTVSSATSTMRASPSHAARSRSPPASLLSSFAFIPRPPHLYLLLLSLLVFFLFLASVLFTVNITPAASTASSAPVPPVASPRPTRPVSNRPTRSSSASPPHVPPVTRLSAVASHPHDSGCFTQGLEWYGDVLYESCGINGQSRIRIVNGSSGRVLQEQRLDRAYFAEGLTVWKERVYQLTWREHAVLVWSLNLTLLQTLTVETEGWGLTHDAQHLILSDGSSRLYYRDPDTFALAFTRDVSIVTTASPPSSSPLRRLNELEYVPGLGLLANVWMTTDVVLIGDDGQVQRRLDAESLLRDAGGDNNNKVVNGLAWNADSNRLWMTGKLWPTMYEVQIPELT